MELPLSESASVMLVIEQRAIGEALADALERKHGLLIVGLSTSVDEALAEARELRPSLVLLDAPMSVAIGLIAQFQRFGARVVALGVREDEGEVCALAEAGVAGCIARDASLSEVAAAAARAANGEAACCGRVARILLQQAGDLSRLRRLSRGRALGLTQRQAQVLDLVNLGLSNKEIAEVLCVELPTVKNHVQGILRKAGVSRRADVAAVMLAEAVSDRA